MEAILEGSLVIREAVAFWVRVANTLFTSFCRVLKTLTNTFIPIRTVRGVCSFMDPAQLKYTPSHEWIAVEGETATVGISDFAIKQLTDLVYIELPAVGTQIEAGQPFGEVESVKAVSDLYAPLNGEVLEVNEALQDDLGVLSDDAYNQGWMLKVKITDPSQLEGMLDRAAYEAHCASQ